MSLINKFLSRAEVQITPELIPYLKPLDDFYSSRTGFRSYKSKPYRVVYTLGHELSYESMRGLNMRTLNFQCGL